MNMRRTLFFFLLILVTYAIAVACAEETTIHVIDVGTGDAVLVQTNDSNILIDAGSDRNSTASYLSGHNITELSLFLVTSHAYGKIGGILEVMNRTTVHEYRDINSLAAFPFYHRITDHIRNESIPYSSLVPGEVIPFSQDGTIEVVPVNQTDIPPDDEVILCITVGNISMLLLSEEAAPQISLKEPVQILRVPDHGSRKGYDARFIQKIQPEIAIINVGREGNGPHKATIMGLEAAGADVYRTDIRGTILIMTDGQRYSMGSSRSSPAGSISLISVIETRPPGN